MQKSKRIKIGVLLGGAILAIAGVVLVISYFLKKEDTYRSILVYELEGSAEIEREKTGNIRAAENIYLESGDRLMVDAGSYVRLKLDDDKYIMVEENSVLSIEAVGDEKDSKTKIQLEKGAVTSEIQNPLSTDSEYEVTSPNSVMAVRGTIFRVETDTIQGNTPRTKTSVFSGKVAMGVRLEDGTVSEEILVMAGEEGVGEGSNPISINKINYSELPSQAIGILQDLSEQGASLEGFTKSDLDELGEKKDTDISENKPENGDNQNSVSNSAENTESSAGNTKRSDNDIPNNTTKTTNTETISHQGSDMSETKPEDNNKPGSDTSETKSNDNKKPGSDISETKPNDNKKPGSDTSETKPGDNKKPDSDTSEIKPDDNNKPGSDTSETKPDDNNKPDENKSEYTVTFEYQGKVFGTQIVKSGQCAKQPTLMPAPFGAWDFDFSTKITKDITITWK